MKTTEDRCVEHTDEVRSYSRGTAESVAAGGTPVVATDRSVADAGDRAR